MPINARLRAGCFLDFLFLKKSKNMSQAYLFADVLERLVLRCGA